MKKLKYLTVFLCTAGLYGCTPTLDTSSFEAAETSISDIRRSLKEDKQLKFDKIVRFYSLGERYMLCPTCLAREFNTATKEKIRGQALQRISRFDGMSYEEIEKYYDEDYPKFVVKQEQELAKQRKRREEFMNHFDF
ncbi:MAG: hypothetical protein II944_04725 [Ruminobacter sp.]|nr:hypothetical protein [Ruminobacter sp.]